MQFDEAWTSDCRASCPIHPASNHPNLRRVVFVQSKKENTIHTDGCFLSDGQKFIAKRAAGSDGLLGLMVINSINDEMGDGWMGGGCPLNALGWWVVRISPTTRPSG